MSGRIVEVQKQGLEIGHRLSESESIYKAPDYEWNKDAHGPFPEKISGGAVQRELQVAGGYDEQRYAGTHE